jgi:hypothetical protein
MSESPTTAAKEEVTGTIELNGNTYRTVTIPLSRPLFLGG